LLTNSKACGDLDNKHVLNRGLAYLKEQTGLGMLTETSSRRHSTTSKSNISCFRDFHTEDRWIAGGDIVAFFHMKEIQFRNDEVKRRSSYSSFHKRYCTNIH
ncbi:hypothetical protein CC77DRAFT_947633, partial [Alternaria alternata]